VIHLLNLCPLVTTIPCLECSFLVAFASASRVVKFIHFLCLKETYDLKDMELDFCIIFEQEAEIKQSLESSIYSSFCNR